MKDTWHERIRADVQAEFAEMQAKLSDLVDSSGVTLARKRMVDELSDGVERRARRLRDTLVNYMISEARIALDNYPASTRNAFHELGIRTEIEERFEVRSAASFEPSFDPRLLTGGIPAAVVAIAGFAVTLILVGGTLLRVVSGSSTFVASWVAFRVGYDAGNTLASIRLQRELDAYLTSSEGRTWEWLKSIEDFFVNAFEDFRSDQGIKDGACKT